MDLKQYGIIAIAVAAASLVGYFLGSSIAKKTFEAAVTAGKYDKTVITYVHDTIPSFPIVHDTVKVYPYYQAEVLYTDLIDSVRKAIGAKDSAWLDLAQPKHFNDPWTALQGDSVRALGTISETYFPLKSEMVRDLKIDRVEYKRPVVTQSIPIIIKPSWYEAPLAYGGAALLGHGIAKKNATQIGLGTLLTFISVRITF